MRRYLIILMLILMLPSLAACGERKPDDLSDLEPEKYDILLPDTVLFDESDIKIVAKGFKDEGKRGGALYIEITNASETDIVVTATGDCTVNGYQIGFIGTTQNGFTPAGETRLYAMRFEDEYLEPLGIEEIHTLNISLKFGEIKDGSAYSSDLGPSDPVEIQLREGKKTAPDGETVIDENGIRILYVSFEKGANFYRVKCYVENDSEADISIRRFLRVEDEDDMLTSDVSFSSGEKGIMTITLDERDTDMELDDIDFLDISLLVRDQATDQILTYRDNYIVEMN